MLRIIFYGLVKWIILLFQTHMHACTHTHAELHLSDFSISQLNYFATFFLFQLPWFKKMAQNLKWEMFCIKRLRIFSDSSSVVIDLGECKDYNFITRSHTHWWHGCDFFHGNDIKRETCPRQTSHVLCISSCSCFWITADQCYLSCGQGWYKVSHECGKSPGLGSVTSVVKFHLGFLLALYLGLLTPFWAFCVFVSKTGMIPQGFLIS